MLLLSSSRMSVYADSYSGNGAEVFTVILIIGFVLYAIIERWRYKNK